MASIHRTLQLKASPDEYKADLDLAIARHWLELHESGTYVRLLTPDGLLAS